MLTFIVVALVVFVVAVLVLWCLSPAYRRRIEQPKYRFQKAVDAYEASVVSMPPRRRHADRRGSKAGSTNDSGPGVNR